MHTCSYGKNTMYMYMHILTHTQLQLYIINKSCTYIFIPPNRLQRWGHCNMSFSRPAPKLQCRYTYAQQLAHTHKDTKLQGKALATTTTYSSHYMTFNANLSRMVDDGTIQASNKTKMHRCGWMGMYALIPMISGSRQTDLKNCCCCVCRISIRL